MTNPCDTLHQGYPQLGETCVRHANSILPHTGMDLTSVLLGAFLCLVVGAIVLILALEK